MNFAFAGSQPLGFELGLEAPASCPSLKLELPRPRSQVQLGNEKSLSFKDLYLDDLPLFPVMGNRQQCVMAQ